MKIPFNNLLLAHEQMEQEIMSAVQRVLSSGWFILGPETEAFEHAFAEYHGVGNAVGVANGTDAIELALRAAKIGPGDEVITVAHTAIATVNAIQQTGATPVLVDVDGYTMDPGAALTAITQRTKAIVPVHIYGQTTAIKQIKQIADDYHLLLIEDCAQSHGARYDGQLAGTFGHLGAFSFYPTKNLGAYGDGGAIITNDHNLAERIRRLRNYGQVSRYVHADEGGTNSRLDEMQSAILNVKLVHLDLLNAQRREIAEQYHHHLGALPEVTLPLAPPEVYHVYHLYVVQHPQRDDLKQYLKDQGISTLIHYPIPVHLQEAMNSLGYQLGDFPETEKVVDHILSLPLFIGLDTKKIDYTCQVIQEFNK